MTTNPAYPADVSLTVGGTTYPFMLVTPKGESKQIDCEEVASPTGIYELRRFSTPEQVQHQDYDLKLDVSQSQSTFIAGVGNLEFTDKTDESAYMWSSGIVTHTDGRAYLAKATTALTIPSGAAPVVGYETFVAASGVHYDFHWQDTRLYRRDASNGTNAWLLVYTANVPITQFKIVNGTGLIAVPTRLDATSPANTDFYIQSDPTAAATWTPTAKAHAVFSDALGKPKFFEQVRGETFAFVDNRKVYYNIDPSLDTWVGPIDTNLTINGSAQSSGPPGDTTYPFIAVRPVNDYMLCFKTDGGYNIDAQQEVTEVLWQWKKSPSSRNFKYLTTNDGVLYFSVAPEIYMYDPLTGRNVATQFGSQSGFSVQDIIGMDSDQNSVYVLATVRVPHVRSTSSTALFRMWRTATSTWTWEVLWEDTGATAYANLGAVPYNNGTRVYWGLASGATMNHMDLPPDYDETAAAGFAATGDMYMSIWATGFPNFLKKWAWIAFQLESVGASNTFSVAYSTDYGVTFTTLQTITSSGLTFVDMTGLVSQNIVMRFRFTSADGTVSPCLRVYDLHGRVRFRYLKQVKATVRVADYIELLNGTRSPLTAVGLMANLQSLRTTDQPISYTDFLGRSFPCSVDVIGSHPSRHEVPDSSWEQEATLQISELGAGS